ncbi:MAG: DUF3568 family protein [Desulfovibrionaceae bacterium]|nr:DUF3568 family protein [Desulfovibrionaceae bacterium]MBF0513496.1 DUF3568 family protein [Desulfovibrionaceae bacterium]
MTRYRLRALAALALALCLCGCAAVVAGSLAAGGTYTYVTGWLKKDYPVSLDKAYRAAGSAAEDLALKVDKTEKGTSSASLTGKDGGSPFWIDIEDSKQGFVFVSVKVGYFGDELASRRIHEAIAGRI